MQPPEPLRILSYRTPEPDGEPGEVTMTPALLDQARRYALEWKAMFGRYPQGQHPLKFPVNKQISLAEADLILEFPVSRVILE